MVLIFARTWIGFRPLSTRHIYSRVWVYKHTREKWRARRESIHQPIQFPTRRRCGRAIAIGGFRQFKILTPRGAGGLSRARSEEICIVEVAGVTR